MINFSNIPIGSPIGKFLRSMLKLVPSGMRVRIIQGPLKGKRWIVGAQTHGMWLGTYESDKQALMTKIEVGGKIALDIGANVGFYSLLFSQMVGDKGKVLAFEPIPRNIEYLRRHIDLNGISNIIVHPEAVADAVGEAKFDDRGNESMGALSEVGRLTVRVVTLDSLNFAPKSVELVKIDVEGGEAGVLRGGKNFFASNRPVIFLATHGEEASGSSRKILSDYQYVIYPMGDESPESCSEWLAIPQERAGQYSNII